MSFGKCIICINSFEYNNISSLKCGQTYHRDCLIKWFNEKKECPKCKMANSFGDIKRLFVDEPDELTTKENNDLHKNYAFNLVKNNIDEFELVKFYWNANKLNASDCGKKLKISKDGLTVKYSKSSIWERIFSSDLPVNCVRAILPIQSAFNLKAKNPSIIFYYEVKTNKYYSNIGFCTKQFQLKKKWLGKEENSIGFLLMGKGRMWIDIDGFQIKLGKPIEFSVFRNVLGIGIIHSRANSSMKCFATFNGKLLGKVELPSKFSKLELFPAVNLNVNDENNLNFGKDIWRFKEFNKLFQ